MAVDGNDGGEGVTPAQTKDLRPADQGEPSGTRGLDRIDLEVNITKPADPADTEERFHSLNDAWERERTILQGKFVEANRRRHTGEPDPSETESLEVLRIMLRKFDGTKEASLRKHFPPELVERLLADENALPD